MPIFPIMPTVELSMIVKNGGAGLARCLRSLSPFVDRIVIGDTGSIDDSKEIARSFGAEVIDIPWEQDFSSARNRVLATRKCDWILIVDADEMIDHQSGVNLRKFIENPDVFACRHTVWHYVEGSMTRIGPQSARKNTFRLEDSRPYGSYVPLDTVRLFRNHPGIYYENRVHETVEKRLADLQLSTASADIVVHHFGFVGNENERSQKNSIYHALCESKLKETPDDPQVLTELGVSELEHHKNPEAALGYFARARDIAPHNAYHWLYCGVSLCRMQKADEALAHLDRAEALGLSTGVLHQARGDAYFQKGLFADANRSYVELEVRGEASETSEAKRGATEVYLGKVDAGLARIQLAIASAPQAAELYDILAPAALLAGRLPLAVEAMQQRIMLGNLTDFHVQLVKAIEDSFNQQQRQPATA